jgi:hypothetical protein
MKKHAVTVLILTLLALPGLVTAQSHKIVAQVPFEFVANGKVMPAGDCTITASGQSQTVLEIACGGAKTVAVPNASESLNASADTVLRFHRSGNLYFLSSISREGEHRGYELPAGTAERELMARHEAISDVSLLGAAK